MLAKFSDYSGATRKKVLSTTSANGKSKKTESMNQAGGMHACFIINIKLFLTIFFCCNNAHSPSVARIQLCCFLQSLSVVSRWSLHSKLLYRGALFSLKTHQRSQLDRVNSAWQIRIVYTSLLQALIVFTSPHHEEIRLPCMLLRSKRSQE